MAEDNSKHLMRGVVAGVAGGLVASWAMNVFMANAGSKVTEAAESVLGEKPSGEEAGLPPEEKPKRDATMKTADAVVSTVTGGRHLSFEQQQAGGPVVHYAFGALMGGLYGALAEYSSTARSGFGSLYGAGLFGGADLVAVPALHLGESSKETPVSALASPFAAHIVYGITTEAVRRLMRAML